MRQILTTILNHWTGKTTYAVESELRPGFVDAAVTLDVEADGTVSSCQMHSVRFGEATWRAGAGLVACTRWESEDEAMSAGGWAGMHPIALARFAPGENAHNVAADALSRLPLTASRAVVMRFVSQAAGKPVVFEPAAEMEMRELVVLSRVAA